MVLEKPESSNNAGPRYHYSCHGYHYCKQDARASLLRDLIAKRNAKPSPATPEAPPESLSGVGWLIHAAGDAPPQPTRPLDDVIGAGVGCGSACWLGVLVMGGEPGSV